MWSCTDSSSSWPSRGTSGKARQEKHGRVSPLFAIVRKNTESPPAPFIPFCLIRARKMDMTNRIPTWTESSYSHGCHHKIPSGRPCLDTCTLLLHPHPTPSHHSPGPHFYDALITGVSCERMTACAVSFGIPPPQPSMVL